VVLGDTTQLIAMGSGVAGQHDMLRSLPSCGGCMLCAGDGCYWGPDPRPPKRSLKVNGSLLSWLRYDMLSSVSCSPCHRSSWHLGLCGGAGPPYAVACRPVDARTELIPSESEPSAHNAVCARIKPRPRPLRLHRRRRAVAGSLPYLLAARIG
jgi:hypothetical protein